MKLPFGRNAKAATGEVLKASSDCSQTTATSLTQDDMERRRLEKEIKQMEAEMERQRLENEIRQMEAALRAQSARSTTAAQTAQPKKIVRRVLKKRVVRDKNGNILRTETAEAAVDPTEVSATEPTAAVAATTIRTLPTAFPQQPAQHSEPTANVSAPVPAWVARRAVKEQTLHSSTPTPVAVHVAPLQHAPQPLSTPISTTTTTPNGKPVHPLAAAFTLGGGSAISPRATVVESVSPTTVQHSSILSTRQLDVKGSSSSSVSDRPVHPLAAAFAKGGGSSMSLPSNVVEATSMGSIASSHSGARPVAQSPVTTNDRPVHPLALAFAKGGGSALAPAPSVVEATAKGSHSSPLLSTQKPTPSSRPAAHPLAAAFANASGGEGQRPASVHPLAAAFAAAQPSGLKSTNTSAPAPSGNSLLAAIQGGVKLKSNANSSSNSGSNSKSSKPLSGNPLMAAIAGGVQLKSTASNAVGELSPPPKLSNNSLLAAIQAGVKLKPASHREMNQPASKYANPLVAALSSGIKLKPTQMATAPVSSGNPLAEAALLGRANPKKTKHRIEAAAPATMAPPNPLQQALAKRNALRSRSLETPTGETKETPSYNPIANVQLKSRADVAIPAPRNDSNQNALSEAMAARHSLKSRHAAVESAAPMAPTQSLLQPPTMPLREAPAPEYPVAPTQPLISDDAEEQKVPLATTPPPSKQSNKVIKKVIKKKKEASKASAPTEKEQADAILAEIAKVEADILARQKLEKEIQQMEAMIAAAQQAAAATPAAPTVALKKVQTQVKAVAPSPSVAPSVVLRKAAPPPEPRTPSLTVENTDATPTHPFRPPSFLASIAEAAQKREERNQVPSTGEPVVEKGVEKTAADDEIVVEEEAYEGEEYFDSNYSEEEYYNEEYYDENLGYYDEDGYFYYYDQENYQEADVPLVEEPKPEAPISRGDLLSSIAFTAKSREKRLEESGGKLIMKEYEPEVAAKKSVPPQLSFSLTEMVTKKAREREARLEAGGEKKMTKIKEKEEYKKDFSSICLEAAALGRLTRLAEHTIEAVAQEKTPEEEWKSQGLLAIQWRSNHMAVIFEAARAGAAFKLPEKIVSNFPELEEDWDYEQEESLTPRMQQLLDLTNEVGTGQHKVDKLVLGIKEENAGGESLLIKPMVHYQNVSDVKLPRPAPPKIDIEKHKKKLEEKVKISKRPLSNISADVAEKAWERRTRLDRPGSLPRMKNFCECPYCINPTPYQTHAYKERARHAKSDAEMKEQAEMERQKIREQRRKKREALMAKRLAENEKELEERKKNEASHGNASERPARIPRPHPPRNAVHRKSISSGVNGPRPTANIEPTKAAGATTVVPGKPTADSRRAMRQARRLQQGQSAQAQPSGSPANSLPMSTSGPIPVTLARPAAVAPAGARQHRPPRTAGPMSGNPTQGSSSTVPNTASDSEQSAQRASSLVVRKPGLASNVPVGDHPRPNKPSALAGAATKATLRPGQANNVNTTTVTNKGRNGTTKTTTTVVRRGGGAFAPPPVSATAPPRPTSGATAQQNLPKRTVTVTTENKGLFGGLTGKKTVTKRIIRK